MSEDKQPCQTCGGIKLVGDLHPRSTTGFARCPACQPDANRKSKYKFCCTCDFRCGADNKCAICENGNHWRRFKPDAKAEKGEWYYGYNDEMDSPYFTKKGLRPGLAKRDIPIHVPTQEMSIFIANACNNITRLAAKDKEIEELRDKLAESRDVVAIWQKDRKEEIERLQAALGKYGRHRPQCNIWLKRFGTPGPCSCGLEQAKKGE